MFALIWQDSEKISACGKTKMKTNKTDKCNYNPNLVTSNKIQKRFPCVCTGELRKKNVSHVALKLYTYVTLAANIIK